MEKPNVSSSFFVLLSFLFKKTNYLIDKMEKGPFLPQTTNEPLIKQLKKNLDGHMDLMRFLVIYPGLPDYRNHLWMIRTTLGGDVVPPIKWEQEGRMKLELHQEKSFQQFHKKPSEKELLNVEFYKGDIPLDNRKDEPYITEILNNWKGDYQKLEERHNYIQWLFPNKHRSGPNPNSSPLKDQEIEIFRNNRELKERVLKAFDLILDFFGMKYYKKGENIFIEHSSNYEGRYENLNNRGHNYARISRILKFLVLIGLESYASAFLKFLLLEIYSTKSLKIPDSSVKIWIEQFPKEKQMEFWKYIETLKNPLKFHF